MSSWADIGGPDTAPSVVFHRVARMCVLRNPRLEPSHAVERDGAGPAQSGSSLAISSGVIPLAIASALAKFSSILMPLGSFTNS